MPSSAGDQAEIDQEMQVWFSQDLDHSGSVQTTPPGTSNQQHPKSETNGNSQVGDNETNGNSTALQTSIIEEESCDESVVLESGLKEEEPERYCIEFENLSGFCGK